MCGKLTEFRKISQGYATYCCFEHYKISELVKEHRKATTLERFGVENCFQSEKCKERAKLTKLTKYGNAYFVNSEKTKKTVLEKYGVDNVSKFSEVKQKIRDTMIKHFGCHNSQDPMCRNRMRTRYVYNDIKFDSSYEIAFYVWHIDHGYNVTRCNESLSYEFDGREYKYFPDFKIDDKFYEVKR